MSDFCTSIIDLPKIASEEDLLGINAYESGLVRFISRTRTPITIAIQGEWGSGKTSLMNSLCLDLCEGEDADFLAVWLNTWQYALMKDSESALISIMEGLTEEVLGMIEGQSEVAKKVRAVFGSVLKASSRVAVRATTGQDIGEVLDAMTGSQNVTILTLRRSLQEAIERILEQKGKSGIIFFIDDLDRIDPPVAVQILELLKNVFDLPHCVFVLAIDYDVVIKGLEPKFGKFTESNEREFRSFFDKIIQLPFSMPVSTYEINGFLIRSLRDIQYINEEQGNNDELISKLSEVTRLSVGTNPRSLKRMFNSLSLIKCIYAGEQDGSPIDENQLLINYAVVNLQIAYPKLYMMLNLESDFTRWDERFAMANNLPPLTPEQAEKLSSQEEFDEEWEQVIFRACEKDFYLKNRVVSVSQFFNLLRDSMPEDAAIGDVIETALSTSSVTSVMRVEKSAKKSGPAVWYLNTGGRDWSDMARFGYWQAGGHARYRKTIMRPAVGDEVFLYMSKRGYLGRGVIVGPAVRLEDFRIEGGEYDGQKLMEIRSELNSPDIVEANPEKDDVVAEYALPIRWVETLPEGKGKRFKGMFTSPQTGCRINHEPTIEFLRREFQGEAEV